MSPEVSPKGTEREERREAADRLARIEKRMARVTVAVITVLGLWLLISPLAPQLSGYAWIVASLQGAHVLLQVVCGMILLLLAGVVKQQNELRQLLHRFMRAVRTRQALAASAGAEPAQVAAPSGDREQDRAAVDILIQAMVSEKDSVRESAHAALKQLTGEDLGPEASAWERWWAQSRSTFER